MEANRPLLCDLQPTEQDLVTCYADQYDPCTVYPQRAK
jgi:hypothetical protein